ncbi:MAG: STAS domain-containing protein [Thermoleophilia bacterium]|nr:STAS domain-containing protein [Thermoleophilia bacterium]
MATTAHYGTRDGESRRDGDARIALGDNRLVIAGHPDDDAPSAIVAAGLAFAHRRRSTVVVLDLDRRAFIIAPGVAPDQGVIALAGELDIASSPMFVGAISVALHHRPWLVLLDVRSLASIDARGAGTVATAAARVRDWGGSLVVRGALPPVERVLDLCGLSHLMGPEGTRPLPPPPRRRVAAPEAVAA